MLAYKIFKKGLKNKYGFKFEINKKYKIDTSKNDLKFGLNGYGFHIVTNLEDGFRYFERDEELDVTLIETEGKLLEFEDEYYGYYDMYVTDEIKILKILTREEILDYMLKTNEDRIIRFIQTRDLNQNDLNKITNTYLDKKVYQYIEFYQYNNKLAFEEEYTKKKRVKK